MMTDPIFYAVAIPAVIMVGLSKGGFGGAMALMGVVLYMVLEDQLARLSPEFWEFGVGLMLVLIVLFGRGGVLGLLDRVRGVGR